MEKRSKNSLLLLLTLLGVLLLKGSIIQAEEVSTSSEQVSSSVEISRVETFSTQSTEEASSSALNINSNKQELKSTTDIKVKYLDEANGKEIYPANHLNEVLGLRYDVTSKKYQPIISGYSLSRIPSNVKGIANGANIEVRYYYKRNSNRRSDANENLFNKKVYSQKNTESISWIPDSVLAQSIADSLGIPVSELTEEAMKQLKVLQLYDGVTDLTGLEHADNLRSLEFYYLSGELPDFTPISGLTHLKEFVSQGNNLTNEKAEMLKKLPTSVEFLYFEEENQLSFDIFNSYPNLKNVTSLNVINCDITDLNFLDAYSSLKSVKLDSNDLKDCSLDILKKFSLTQLSLENTNLSQIAKLPTLLTLTDLDLSYNDIQDFSEIPNKFNLSNLEFLNLSETQLSSLEFLSTLGNSLKFLSLDGNEISDVSPLKKLPNSVQINILDQTIEAASVTIPSTRQNSQKNNIKTKDGSYVDLIPDNTHNTGNYDKDKKMINWTVSSEDKGELKSIWSIGEETDSFCYSGSLTVPYILGNEGQVTIKYIDEYTGEEIHESQILEGKIGDNYDVSGAQYKLNLQNYTIDDSLIPSNTKGSFTKESTVVVYKYNKIVDLSKYFFVSSWASGNSTDVDQSEYINSKIDRNKIIATEQGKGTYQNTTLTSKRPIDFSKDWEMQYSFEFYGSQANLDGWVVAFHNEYGFRGKAGYASNMGVYNYNKKGLTNSIVAEYDFYNNNSASHFFGDDPNQNIAYSHLGINRIENQSDPIIRGIEGPLDNTWIGNKSVLCKLKWSSSVKELSLEIGNKKLSKIINVPEELGIINDAVYYTIGVGSGSANALGFTSEFIYQKYNVNTFGQNIVRYVDEEGNELSDKKIMIGDAGTDYDSTTPEYLIDIPGYEIDNDKLPSNRIGRYDDIDEQVITYVYKKVPEVEAMGYIEVPQKIHLRSVQINNKEYVAGKGKIQYHSIDGVNDREIEVFTDPEVALTSKPVDEDEKEETVNVQVYYSDNSTLIEKDKSLGEVSKTNPHCDFYLKTLKNHFIKANRQYEGKMTFTVKFK